MKYRTRGSEDREPQAQQPDPGLYSDPVISELPDIPDDNKALQPVSRPKKKKSVLNLILGIAAALLAVASISMYLAPQLLVKPYSDEEEFRNHADQAFRQIHLLPEKANSRVVTYDYSEDISVALRYDPSEDEKLAVFRDQRIREAENDFRKRALEEEERRKAEKGDSLLYRPLQHVLLIDTAVYESGTGAKSLAIYTEEYKEENRSMEKADAQIDTWLFSDEDLKKLNPSQVFTADYKDKAAAYIRDYVKQNYDREKIGPEEEKYLEVNAENYNKYVINNKEMTFFFDEGTILRKEEGVTAVNVQKQAMGSSIRASIVERYIDPKKPMVALTYDDGPGFDAETRILKCLKKYDAVATFFYLGNRVKSDKNNVKLAYSLGCEIGNHSWDHSNLAGLDADGVKSQISKTNKAIKGVIGINPTVFRPPYGASNETVMKASGMPSILWTVDTLDWSSRDAKKIVAKVKKTKKLDGKIILMHSLYDETAAATEKLVPWLEKKGYQLVTVTELIKYKTGEAPKAGESYN